MKLECDEQTLTWNVPKTGESQEWREVRLGRLRLNETTKQSLELRAVEKRAGSVMEVQRISLTPIDPSSSF